MKFRTRKGGDGKTGKHYSIYDIVEIFPEERWEYEFLEDYLEEAEQIAKDASDFSGFPVTKEAVEYQIENWLNNCHSGYRDDGGGYHLFSFAYDRDFSIIISPLREELDWQTTFYA